MEILIQYRLSRCCSLAAVMIAFLASSLPVGAETLLPSTTARQARSEAIRALPFDQLNEEATAKLRSVVTNPSIFRRLPTESIDCNPEMYLFLVRHPEVVIDILNNMGATDMTVRRIDEYRLACDDGNGTQSTVELVFGTSDLHVLYAEGVYDGPLWPRPIRGRSVMLLRSAYRRQADGSISVVNQLDVFIQVDNGGAELIARSLHPLMGRTADSNFVQSIAFLTRIHQSAQENGPGLIRLVERLPQIDAKTRGDFSELTIKIWDESENTPATESTRATPTSFPQRQR